MTAPNWPPDPIKLLILDVDGTLTDGGLYYGADGLALKRFSVRDGLGLVAVQKLGVEVVLISGDETPIVPARAARLGIRAVYMGCDDKAPVVREVLAERQLPPEQAVFMGDDMADLPAMDEVARCAAPADAMPVVRERVDYVTQAMAGHGAVREVCDLIAMRLAADAKCDDQPSQLSSPTRRGLRIGNGGQPDE